MRYTKPELHGYAAIAAIQFQGSSKQIGPMESLQDGGNPHSQPAYEADEG